MPTGRSTHALVLGGGLAGTLAAFVLARHVDHVTIVDRDRFPDGPVHRKGTPHGRHTHVLLAGGCRALEELLPGVTKTLTDAGAQRLGVPNRLLTFTQAGWLPRFDEMQFLISCSRGLFDCVVRKRILPVDRIEVVEATDVVGLLGDSTRVTGARVRDRDTGSDRQIDADFTVDATGRGSRADQWLVALGLPSVREDRIDPGMVYATRVYRAPAGAEKGFPGISVQGDPRSMSVGQGGTLVPIEDGRWIVTLGGTRGGEPDTDQDGFINFARRLRHPAIADLIGVAQPLTRPFGFHGIVNRRRRYERLTPWPQGFVVLGDAACTFNPIYGHGMTVAARQAVALRDGLERYGLDGRATRHLQRGTASAITDAWDMAVSQDLRYPGTVGPHPGPITGLRERYLDRLIWAATGRPAVTRAQIDAYTLSTPARRLLAPRIILGTLRGPGRQPLTDPPFTSEELRILASAGTENPP